MILMCFWFLTRNRLHIEHSDIFELQQMFEISGEIFLFQKNSMNFSIFNERKNVLCSSPYDFATNTDV